ncbi:hypothetical protein ES705_37943 [subsurface metagenome]
MNETITQPIFFPGRINPLEPELWYFSKFGIWVSERFWEDATPVQAFLLGLFLIGLVVMIVYLGIIWVAK